MGHCTNCGVELPEGAGFCPKCGTTVAKVEGPTVVAPVSAPIAGEPVIATWGERFVAWLIDVLIVGAVAWIIGAVAGFTGNLIPGWPSWIPFFSLNLTGVLQFFYWMLMEGAYGQSFGKMVMKLKVTMLDGKPANMGQSAIQSLGKAFILFIDVLLGFFLFNKKRQRVFNYLSRTIVVRAS